MSSAMGILCWEPNSFWGATVYEYTSAMKGYLVSKGVNSVEPMDRNEYLALKRQDENNRKRGS